ncbi:MAG TPA: alternative ribosome rescue aminoacyl-tRNA hydrolase ArfB [Actinomycetota bacterium]|jgi:ribosome-associated protein|nr:alternative ribosome rescue aminoacyl-tRNA hydrolase ArfB [Actinomycetota bacterium]
MDDVRVTPSVLIPARELAWRFSRSGGPGGQNVNRRETQVELVFDVERSPSLGPRQRERVLRRLASRLDASGRLHIVASEGRTQGVNREIAVDRLRQVLADALRPDPPKRRRTRPTAGATERRLESKRRRSLQKRERGWRPDD